MIEKIIKGAWGLLSKIILFFLRLLFKIIRKPMDESIEKAFLQFCKFALVGVSNTIVSYGLNALSLLLFDALNILPTLNIYVANCIAFFLSVLWSYLWNSRYVFKEKDGQKRVWWKTLIKTYVAYAFTGLLLSNVISWVCVGLLGINKFVAPVINLVIAVPINYFLNKIWAYGQSDGKEKKQKPSKYLIEGVVFLFISLTLLSHFLLAFSTEKGVEVQNSLYFRSGEDYMADLYNVMDYSRDYDPYHSTIRESAEKAYFPMSYMLTNGLYRFFEIDNEYGELTSRELQIGFGLFIVIINLLLVLSYYSVSRGKAFSIKGNPLALPIALSLVFTGPVFYCFERGNLAILVPIFMTIFVATFNSENKILRELGYISLSFAAALKGYPAILGLILIYRKEFKEAIRLIIYGIASCLLPFLYFKGGLSNVPIWFENLGFNSEKYRYYGGDVIGFKFFPVNCTINNLEQLPDAYDTTRIIVIILAIVGVLLSYFIKKDSLRIAMMISAILMIPENNFYYALVMVIPMVVAILREEDKDLRLSIPVLILSSVMLMLYRIPGENWIEGVQNTIYVANIALYVLFVGLILLGIGSIISTLVVAIRHRKGISN